MFRPRFRTVKRCIFCTNKADSREHVWSEWAMKGLSFDRGVEGQLDGLPVRDRAQRHVRVKCVCVACNTGWMKAIEDAVIPSIGAMMRDHPTSLSASQQAVIARWAVKTAMIFEHTTRGRDLFYMPQEHVALRHGALPPRTTVWIARFDGTIRFWTLAAEATGTANVAKMRALLTTMAFGRFAAQVLTVRHDEPNAEELPRLDGDSHRWDDFILRVSPEATDCRWPPLRSIAPNALDQFHQRFGGPNSAGAG